MSDTPTKLTIAKNKLDYIATEWGQPLAPDTGLTFIDGAASKKTPSIADGTIYFATKDNDNTDTIKIHDIDVTIGHNRAYIFLDDDGKRYAITGPVDWSEILNKPLNSILSNLTMATTGNLHNLELRYLNNTNLVQSAVALPFVLQSGDTMTGALNMASHIYLTGATTTSTGNTSQIVFGTSANNHVAISSNPNTLVINPSTSSTDDQIVLYLERQSLFPKGIDAGSSDINAANFVGLATNANKDASGNVITSTYIKSSYITDNNIHNYIPLSNTNGHTLKYKLGSNSDSSQTQNLPFVLLSGDTMTGALTIARNNSTTSPRVSLDYNDTTDSLDFIFT